MNAEELTDRPQIAVSWDGDRAPLAKAFVAAQKATEAVKKAATNPAFRSKYADLAEVVEAVVPALNANGVGVLQFPSYDGQRVHVATTFLHEGGSSVTGTLSMPLTKSDAQGVGSAITYARRYSLLAMAGAAPEDDDGNAAARRPANEPAPPAAKISEEEIDDLKKRMAEVGADPTAFLKFMKVGGFESLDYARAVAALERKRSVAAE